MLTGCCKPTPHYLPPFVSKVEASSSWHLPDLDRSSEVLYRRGGRNKRYAVARIDWCEAVLPPAIVSTKQLGIVWCALAFDPAICTCGTCRIPTVGPPFYQTLAMGSSCHPPISASRYTGCCAPAFTTGFLSLKWCTSRHGMAEELRLKAVGIPLPTCRDVVRVHHSWDEGRDPALLAYKELRG